MKPWASAIVRRYATYARGVGYLQDIFLLVIRLYWGWSFAVAGWGKLTNLDSAAAFFASIGIPMPEFSAVMSGCVELGGGALLLLGLASRLIAPVLIVNMAVAYATAHTVEALSLFSHPHVFVTAPPFLYLLACVIVLLFGPGLLSLDAAIAHFLKGRESVPALAAKPSGLGPTSAAPEAMVDRRRVVYLATAAVGGIIAGALLRGLSRSGVNRNDVAQPPTDAKPVAGIKELDAQAPAGIQPSLMLGDQHVCRGLNVCKGKDKVGKNACAGRGTCAIAAAHSCNGLNDCKGQGGCGDYPGQNTCKGKGACAVPLKDETWAKARKVFEKLMTLKKQEIGAAPAKI